MRQRVLPVYERYELVLQIFSTTCKYHVSGVFRVDVEVFASNEFVRIYDVALTYIRLLEVGSTETSDEVGSLKPWDNVCSNQQEEKRDEPRKKQGPKRCRCHLLRRIANTVSGSGARGSGQLQLKLR